MSQLDKLKIRLYSIPNDFTYPEAYKLLTQLGFEESNKGRTSGSRVKFYRSKDQKTILLHKPHPGNVIVIGAVRQLADFVKELEE